MGMMQIDNAMNAPAELRAAKSMENLTCLTIRTGNAQCVARFYPALYQLTLVKNGVEEKVDLGFSGSRLLERLVRSPGEVVDRDELMSHAWPGRVVGQGSLNQQIYTLRQILADESEREIIQTLPRRGYLLNPNFVDISLESTAVEPPASEPATPTPAGMPDALLPLPVETLAPIVKKSWRLPTLAGLSVLLVLGAGLAYHQITNSKPPAANAQGKLLSITYAPQHPDKLANLISLGEQIEQQLTTQVKEPVHLLVGENGDQLHIICLHANGNARSLPIAQSQLAQLTVNDWAPCLP